MNDADMIIIGGGPSGCAAAIRARQAGLRAIIFDANPSSRMVPGETLHPGIEPILNQLGVLDDVLNACFHRHLGIWIERGSQRHFSPYGKDENGPWLGFQVDRRKFQRILQLAAVAAGAKLLLGTRPSNVILIAGRVIGIEVAGIQYRARWTIDATGHKAWLAGKLGLRQEVRSPPLRARFGWRSGALIPCDNQPLFILRDDGWDWQAPLGGDRIAWVELRVAKLNDPLPSGVDLTWKYHPQCAGPGFFLLGDAAASLDPSSSHGVLRALMSGILCGHLVSGCQHTSIAEEIVAGRYREWLTAQFEHDEKHVRRYYANLPSWQAFEGCDSRGLSESGGTDDPK